MIPKEKIQWMIQTTLKKYDLYSPEAYSLVYGTIIQESRRGQYRRQWVDNFDIMKHALGIAQMERNTFNWLMEVYINKYPVIRKVQFIDLCYNDPMSILFCRLRYRVVPKKIPLDLLGQAQYYKKYYNTSYGLATVEDYIENYNKWR